MENISIDRKRALVKLQALCARSEKCSGDVIKKLALWQLSATDSAWVLQQLITDGFVNDARFARFYVRDKALYNRWGRIKIRTMLRAKGVDSEIVDLALKEFPEEQSRDSIVDLLGRKLPQIRAKSEYELKSKLVRFGVSRGFELDVVISEAEKLIRARGEADDDC